MVTFAFLRRFRHIFSLIAQISKTIGPTATARVPKALQSRELHFCRKKSIFFCLFGPSGRNILRTRQLTLLVILSEKVLLDEIVRAADWDQYFCRLNALLEKLLRRISMSGFLAESSLFVQNFEFFLFMFFADLLTSRVLLEAPKTQRPWYLS